MSALVEIQNYFLRGLESDTITMSQSIEFEGWIEEIDALIAGRDALLEALSTAVEMLDDCWSQFAFENAKGEKVDGGLSTLEWLRDELPRLRATLSAAPETTAGRFLGEVV